MWLRVSSAIALTLAFGCAGDSNDPPTDTAPVGTGGSAGMMGVAGGMTTPPTTTAGVSGGPPPVTTAGGGGVGGPATNAGAGGVSGGAAGMAGQPMAGAAGMAGAEPMAGAGGMAGSEPMAGAGGMAGSEPMAGAGGMAGGMSAGDCGPMAFACRGDAPTAMSANGRQRGPYKVTTYTSGYKRGTFDSGTMHYPDDPAAKPPFGCVAVVPGFVSPESSIRTWGPFLASHGIVTITIGVPGGDQPATRASKLMSALDSCASENDRMGSPLMGKISKAHLGVSGWSMGGGGTLIAASQNPDKLKAAVSFAAWGPSGGANNKVPALMFEATADALAAAMSDGFYRATPDTTPKMLFEVQGSSHNVANSPSNHEGIIGLYGLAWWKVFLEGDERYKQFLTAPKPSITTSKFATNVK